jgi:hypothetical protein
MIGFVALLLASSVVHAQPILAKAGDCGWVHGRYVEANGSRVRRIFVLRTGHALNVDIPDEGDNSIPMALQRYYDTGRFVPLKTDMLADFYVCAVERRVSGSMQRVDLKRVRNVRIITY